jgi:hypothetical protein
MHPSDRKNLYCASQAEDTKLHSRLPSRLVAQWRHQHDAPRSKSTAFPPAALSALERHLAPVPGSQGVSASQDEAAADGEAAVAALVAAAVAQARFGRPGLGMQMFGHLARFLA